MNISRPFIRLPVMTTLLMIALLFFGISSYFKIPTSALPNISYPTIQVNTNFPGASAEKMANLITGPLERQFMSNVTDVNVMTSESYYQQSQIVIQFNLDKDIVKAMEEVQQGINEAQNQLPDDLPQLPTYKNVNPAQTPIIYLLLTSPTETRAKLYEWTYTFLGQRLSLIDGVAQVFAYGYPHAVRLYIDPQAAAARDIGLNEIEAYFHDANPDYPVGNFYGKDKLYNIQSNAQLFNAEDYNSLIVTYRDGQPVKLSDIGYATNGIDNNKQFFKVITPDTVSDCCVLAILRQDDANTVNTVQRIFDKVDEYKPQLPGNLEMIVPYDQSIWIKESIKDVEFTLLIALILVVTIIFLYLGRLRDTVIPSITLPLTIIGTWAFMYIFGYSLDILSLLALTLSIGFLVDDAIIVLENIVRHVHEGKTPYQAALDGSKQISFTVLSTSLSLCAVFIPMLFMDGVIGKLFHEFAATIIIAIIISSFISLSLTPMLCSRFIPPVTTSEKQPWMEKKSEQINNYLIHKYEKSLAWAIKHKFTFILIGACCIFANIFLYTAIPKTFLPEEDLSIVQIFVQSVESTSPYVLERYQTSLTQYFQKDPDVNQTVSIMGSPTANQGVIFANLKPPKERGSIEDIVEKYWKDLNQIPGVLAFPKIYPFINLQIGSSTSGKGQYQYTMESFNSDQLYKSAAQLIQAMKSEPEFAQVSSDLQLHQPQVEIEILREQARSYHLTAKDIQQALQLAFGETYIVQLNSPQNQYYVVMQVDDRFNTDPTDFSLIYAKSSETGEMVPIDSVVNQVHSSGPINVNHTDGLPSVTISFNLPPKLALGTAITKLEQMSKSIIPEGVIGNIEGSASVFKQSFSSLKFLFIIALFVIYLILGILYENFIHPLTVLSTLPPAVLGGFFSLFIFRMPLSLYAFVGVIMLLGIVLKNGIMMIDFANEFRLHDTKISPSDAMYKAASLRFRPILMTTLSTIMGALPIALGVGGTMAKGRVPLGVAIIGGLIFSQLMTLFITPCVYIYLETFVDWIQKKSSFFRGDPDGTHHDTEPPANN
ncbi:MAG: Multidrug resistance protein MdtC [Chlamydiae bacterium]|nr:Multidrug resistance protein MdtC [Chlamydiota bacterium]